ncbi:hypothetical protein QTH97_16550 [Variovorax sp. J22R24]|uniref:hypothetical protein n=1 Tax=Variovorax gracilis TaxID=3053502 RepID=UPI0025780A12|nr:hypothetical protein [Variovorax sp. J22R24]MDM0106558.1 hypothetical protein [Variovorax sp. J22R24]
MAKKAKSAPTTYGELRKLLAASGNPWRPDPAKSNDERLPVYTTGGDGKYEPASRVLGKGGVDEVLKHATPPLNPELRAVWQDEGLLPLDEKTNDARRKPSSRAKSAPTRAPDEGG